MLQFLRLFPSFRHLEAVESEYHTQLRDLMADNATLTNERDQAQAAMARADQERTEWKERANHWEERFIAATNGQIHATELTADWAAVLRFGKPIFGTGPELPEHPPKSFEPIMKQRTQARTLVQEAEAKFNRELQEFQRKNMESHRQQQYTGVETKGNGTQ